MKSGLSKEVNILRRHMRIALLIRRSLALAVLTTVVFVVLIFYETIEASYLDLVDSLISDSPTAHGDLPLSIPLDLEPCDDETGWIEEYISSGIMPRCSLAHEGKIDILYTYGP
jgi:hypothetical protein